MLSLGHIPNDITFIRVLKSKTSYAMSVKRSVLLFLPDLY